MPRHNPQVLTGKEEFSPVYQNVLDFLREYAKSGSFDALDNWLDTWTIAIAQHLVNALPEKYPESKPGELVNEEIARKYVCQFVMPMADTRLGGVCIHLWGEVAT